MDLSYIIVLITHVLLSVHLDLDLLCLGDYWFAVRCALFVG